MEAIDITDYDFVLPIDEKAIAEAKKYNRNYSKKPPKKIPEPTVWIISTLTYEQDTYLENAISRNTPDGDVAAMIMNMGVKGVSNFNLNGKPVKLTRVTEADDNKDLKLPGDLMPLTNEFVSHIPVMQRIVLQNQIRFGRAPTEQERKNS